MINLQFLFQLSLKYRQKTIGQLKEKIYEKLQMNDESYSLFFKGHQLDTDSNPLNKYGIKNNDTILIEKSSIFIKFRNVSIKLKISPENTLSQLKEKINEKLQMNDESYCLFFEGHQLDIDSNPLNKYGIKNNDTINLIEKSSIFIKYRNDIIVIEIILENRAPQLKEIINEKLQMDDESYCLFFKGHELYGDPLISYGIKNKDTIKLIEKENKEILSFLYKFSYYDIDFDIPNDIQNTRELKKLISEKIFVPLYRIKIFF